MFGVYGPDGTPHGHHVSPGDASRAALRLGEGARVTSAGGGYVVRDGTLRRACRRLPAAGVPWQPLPTDYIAGTMAALYGGSQN